MDKYTFTRTLLVFLLTRTTFMNKISRLDVNLYAYEQHKGHLSAKVAINYRSSSILPISYQTGQLILTYFLTKNAYTNVFNFVKSNLGSIVVILT